MGILIEFYSSTLSKWVIRLSILITVIIIIIYTDTIYVHSFFETNFFFFSIPCLLSEKRPYLQNMDRMAINKP